MAESMSHNFLWKHDEGVERECKMIASIVKAVILTVATVFAAAIAPVAVPAVAGVEVGAVAAAEGAVEAGSAGAVATAYIVEFKVAEAAARALEIYRCRSSGSGYWNWRKLGSKCKYNTSQFTVNMLTSNQGGRRPA